MPYLADHFHALQPSERLNPHNIGLKNNFRGLFLLSYSSLICFKIDHSIRWELTNTDIRDFCIDQENKLLFYSTRRTIYAVALESGEELWSANKDYTFDHAPITCSPKNKLIFCSQTSGSYQYIYIYNYSGERVSSKYLSTNKIKYLDRADRLLFTDTYGVKTSDKELLNTASIETVSGNGFHPSTAGKKNNEVYVYSGSGRLKVGNPMVPVDLKQVSNAYLYSGSPTDTVEEDFIYYSDINGDYQFIVKIDLTTGLQVYRKQIRAGEYGSIGQSVTQDASHLYQIGDTRRTENAILVIDKANGNIVDRIVNPGSPGGTTAGLKVLHTYDSLT